MNSFSTNPHVDIRDLARVVIVGTSGAGKTTLAKTLADMLGAAHIEIDALHWKPEWVPRPTEELRALAVEAVAVDRWVADGNYGQLRDVMWGRATAVIWLNYSFPVVLARVIRRTVRRIVLREELYSRNRERFLRSFFTRDSIILWTMQTFRRRRARLRSLFDKSPFSHLRLIELRRPAETTALLGSLRSDAIRFGIAQGADTNVTGR